MLLLFALSAYAQPSVYGGIYGYSSAGTPALAYASPSSVYAPASTYGQYAQYGQSNARGQSSAIAPTPSARDNQFDRYSANQVVRSAEVNANGNKLIYNDFLTYPSGAALPLGLLGYGNQQKSVSAAIDENRIQDTIDEYRATHPQMTQADRNHLNDLQLQRDSAHNQKVRRTVSIINPLIPGTGGSLSAIYARRSNADDEQLATNSLVDARQSFQQDPSHSNLVTLRNAQNDQQQAEDRRDANTFDILGNVGGAYKIAPVLRKKASGQKLDTGYRNLRNAQDAYAKDPSEDNRLALRLARLFVQATSQEDDANTDEVAYSSLMGGNNIRTYLGSIFLNNKNFQDEANIWLRYHRLERYILLRKQQQGTSSSSANQMSNLPTDGSQSSNQNPSSLSRSTRN